MLRALNHPTPHTLLSLRQAPNHSTGGPSPPSRSPGVTRDWPSPRQAGLRCHRASASIAAAPHAERAHHVLEHTLPPRGRFVRAQTSHLQSRSVSISPSLPFSSNYYSLRFPLSRPDRSRRVALRGPCPAVFSERGPAHAPLIDSGPTISVPVLLPLSPGLAFSAHAPKPPSVALPSDLLPLHIRRASGAAGTAPVPCARGGETRARPARTCARFARSPESPCADLLVSRASRLGTGVPWRRWLGSAPPHVCHRSAHYHSSAFGAGAPWAVGQ